MAANFLSSISDTWTLLTERVPVNNPLANNSHSIVLLLLIAPIVAVVLNVLSQLVRTMELLSSVESALTQISLQVLWKDKRLPPVVFHWFPFIGSALSYGKSPVDFARECREKVSRMKRRIFRPSPTDSHNFSMEMCLR
jgi:sterol 14alpha-demethylase